MEEAQELGAQVRRETPFERSPDAQEVANVSTITGPLTRDMGATATEIEPPQFVEALESEVMLGSTERSSHGGNPKGRTPPPPQRRTS